MPSSDLSQNQITRRRLATLTAAGGSALFLAACGVDADPNADRSDAELLGDIRALQSELADGYESLGKGKGNSADEAVAFAEQSRTLLGELDKALGDLDEKPPQPTFTANLDVATVYDYEPFLIGVVNAVVPSLGDEDLQELAYRVSAASAGRVAAHTLSGDPGADPSPKPFVLGELPPNFKGVD